MAQTLNFFLPQEALHPTFNTLDMTLLAYGEEGDAFQLNVANAIWAQQGFQFLQSYLDLLAENYGAGLNTLDFAGDPEGAAETINNWVSEQTEERITDLIAPDMLNAAVRLILTNAIYFKGQWALPFEESATQDESFTLLDDSTVTVPMMSQTEGFRYVEADDYQAVALSYFGAPVSMIIVLPREGQFEEVESMISAEFVDDLAANWGFQSVALSMPKFTYEGRIEFPYKYCFFAGSILICGGLCTALSYHQRKACIDFYPSPLRSILNYFSYLVYTDLPYLTQQPIESLQSIAL